MSCANSATRDIEEDQQERCRILGLELCSYRSIARVSAALQAYGRDSDVTIAKRCISSGFIGQQLVQTEQQVQALLAIRDRLASSLNASTSTRGGSTPTSMKGPQSVQVLGKARPRAHAVVAHEHLETWCEQHQASLDNLRVRSATSCHHVNDAYRYGRSWIHGFSFGVIVVYRYSSLSCKLTHGLLLALIILFATMEYFIGFDGRCQLGLDNQGRFELSAPSAHGGGHGTSQLDPALQVTPA